jgi:hypothetical protein
MILKHPLVVLGVSTRGVVFEILKMYLLVSFSQSFH